MAISRARLVDAARDLNEVLDLEPEIDVKLGVGKLREMVEEAGRMVRATDRIADDTRAVINELTEADDVEDSASETEESESASEEIMTKSRKAVRVATEPRKAVKAAAKPATAKVDKKSELGRFSPVRRNSSLGKILEACLTDSSPTVERVAKSVGISRDKVIPILRRARVTHGIDHGEGEDGELTIILPKGVDADSMWHKPKERPVKAGTVEAGNGRIRENRAGKPPKDRSEFHPIKPGTIRERLVGLMDGTRTIRQIAGDTGLTNANASSHIYCLHRDCGLGYSFDGGGRVRLLLPRGVPSAVKSVGAVSGAA